jgi:hypothetical protein
MPHERIEVFGRRYRDAGHGDFTGFYDWLRQANENLVGLRWWPFEWPVFLFDVLGSRAYSSVDPAKRFVDIWSTSERTFVPELSKDHDFGGNKIFVSESLEYLLSFHVDRLSPQALERLVGKDRMPSRGD